MDKFNRLYDQFWVKTLKMSKSISSGINNGVESEVIQQEVWINIYLKIEEIDESNIMAYARNFARNAIRKSLREYRFKQENGITIQDLTYFTDNEEDIPENEEIYLSQVWINDFLSSLTEEEKQVIAYLKMGLRKSEIDKIFGRQMRRTYRRIEKLTQEQLL